MKAAAHHAVVLAIPLIGSAWLARLSSNGDALPGTGSGLVALLAATLSILAVLRCLWLWRQGRWTDTSLLPLRLAVVFAVTSWSAVLVFVQPFTRTAVVVSTSIALAVYALSSLVTIPDRRIRDRPFLRWVDVVAFNLCVVALLFELGARLYARIVPHPLFAAVDATVLETIEQERFPPRMMYNGRPLDHSGFNDDPVRERAPDERLVVGIGDSFSVGIVPHHYLYTTVAERLLDGIQIYNVGINGCGPNEYLHLLRYVALPLQPDAVVVALYVGNDLSDSSRGDGTDLGLRRWYDRSNILMWQVPRRLMRLAQEPGIQRLEGRRVLSPAEYAQYREITREQMLMGMPWLEDVSQKRPTLSEKAFLEMERWKALQVCSVARHHYDRLFIASVAGSV